MRLYIRYIVLIFSVLSITVFLFFPRSSSAQGANVETYFNLTIAELQQLYVNQINMYTNCLEPYYVDEQGGGRLSGDSGTDYGKSSWNGNTHVVQLKNKANSPFLADSPIQVARTINNVTMCALDKDNKPACTTLYQQQTGNTAPNEDFKLLDIARSQLITTDGNLTIPHVKSYSAETVNHDFIGVQYFAVQSEGQEGEDTDGNSLKLATFRPAQEVPEGAADCLQIHWDPYGKVIDAQSLEPIKDATVTLFYRDNTGNRTQVPMNTGILPQSVRSTFQTSADGAFNFPVSPGTYFLETVKSGFTFPIEEQLLERVRASLQQKDPLHNYLNSEKLYNNPNEEIVVTSGNPQERNIVMKQSEPTDNKPEIQFRIVRNNDIQVITGTVSHPLSIIQAFIENGQIGQTTAEQNGFFRMEIASSSLPTQFDPNSVYLQATKQPIIDTPLQALNTTMFDKLWRIFHSPVYASINNTSARYPLKLIPLYLGGFTYNDSLKLTPYALVQITIPSLGNAIYSQARADKNGFVYIGKNFIPMYPFDVRISDGTKKVVAIYEANEFISLNKTYTAEKKISYFAPPETAVSSPATFIPSVQLVKEVQAVELQKSKAAVTVARMSSDRRSISIRERKIIPTPIASNSQELTSNNNKNVGILAALVIIILLIPIGIGFIIMKARNRTGTI